jgi:hypothetical protein
MTAMAKMVQALKKLLVPYNPAWEIMCCKIAYIGKKYLVPFESSSCFFGLVFFGQNFYS